MKRYTKFFHEDTTKDNIYNEIAKILVPFGFHNNCMTEITRRFLDKYQDLDYNEIINDLLENWDMDVVTAQKVFNAVKELDVIIE